MGLFQSLIWKEKDRKGFTNFRWMVCTKIWMEKLVDDELVNTELRTLNYEYFWISFKEENGFNLDDIQDGLQELALPYKKDVELKKNIERLVVVFVQRQVFITRWLLPWKLVKMGDEIKVIDPEFCFMAYANLIWACCSLTCTLQQKSAMTLMGGIQFFWRVESNYFKRFYRYWNHS
jgi:5-methylthioribose kinase